MTVQELINDLSHYDSDSLVMIQDTNAFINDVDFVCTENIEGIKKDIVLLVAGQLQGCDYDGTRID